MILDLFAGPGGWDEGALTLGLRLVGIEWDAAACATRDAAGHRTIRADVASLAPWHLAGRVEGLIASPPCPDWSSAGKRRGRAGDSGWLVDLPLEWADRLRPRWIAWEQVPEVLSVWQDHAAVLRSWGYSAWAGILCAADYGVPQTRRRAILIAHRDRPVQPPEATHAENPQPQMFGPELKPWVSMAEAIGVDWIDTRQTNGRVVNGDGSHGRAGLRPATTVCADPRLAPPGHRDRAGGEPQFPDGTVRLTIEQAAILQGFRADYPWQGTKMQAFQQVGNAVPPSMAAAILSAFHPNPTEEP